MNPGELRNRIVIQRQLTVKTGVFESVAYTDICTIWAKVNGLFGKEYWSAMEYSKENTVEFTIRVQSCKDLSCSDRIVFKEKMYNITGIDDVLFKGQYYKIKATSAGLEHPTP